MHDVSPALEHPRYRLAGDALLELARAYDDRMDVDWDGSRGFPPGWRKVLTGGVLVKIE